MSVTDVLILIVIISGLIHIRAEYYQPKQLKYIFKPLTIFTILIIAALSTTADPSLLFYKKMIIAGLFFSLWGDVFLMLPSDRFIPGLISFLIAHIFYIIAFSVSATGFVPFFYIIPFILYGFLVLGYLRSDLGRLKIPVLIYMIAIMTMGFLAMNLYLIQPDSGHLYAFIGSVFFMVSDTLLAIRKFQYDKKKHSKKTLEANSKNTEPVNNNVKVRGNFKAAQLLILSTYYTAQVFIALSVH